MPKTAALILNRNLPALTDELGDWIVKTHGDQVDVLVLENGSDPDKYSKYATIILKESIGPAAGVNAALRYALQQDYTHFWVSYNDARFTGESFLENSLTLMQADARVGLCFPYWDGGVWIAGKLSENIVTLSHSDILSFIVSRSTLEFLSTYTGLRQLKFDPFWDSTNFTAHYNMLAPIWALSTVGRCAVADTRCGVYEKGEAANQQSELARGFSDEAWKHDIGPKYIREWLTRVWPNIPGTPKEVRNKVIMRIRRQLVTHGLANPDSWQVKLRTRWHEIFGV